MRYLLAMVLLVAFVAPVKARYYYRTSRHVYYIDTQNEHYRPIFPAHVFVSESGDYSAYISVEAYGYRDAYERVRIHPNRTSVYVVITMRDPTVTVDVTDRSGMRIPNAYVSQNQFGARADEYRIEIRMPPEGFTMFTRRDVQLEFFFTPRINVLGTATHRRVEIFIPRRQFRNRNFVRVRVRIPSDAELQQAKRNDGRKKAFEILHTGTH